MTNEKLLSNAREALRMYASRGEGNAKRVNHALEIVEAELKEIQHLQRFRQRIYKANMDGE